MGEGGAVSECGRTSGFTRSVLPLTDLGSVPRVMSSLEEACGLHWKYSFVCLHEGFILDFLSQDVS